MLLSLRIKLSGFGWPVSERQLSVAPFFISNDQEGNLHGGEMS